MGKVMTERKVLKKYIYFFYKSFSIGTCCRQKLYLIRAITSTVKWLKNKAILIRSTFLANV